MKTLWIEKQQLVNEGRWDIDFHLPAEGIQEFPKDIIVRIDDVATIGTEKRDPSLLGEGTFQYIDIAAVDVTDGQIVNPQELSGEEAPSRARKVVRAYDIIVSTCRPTRGAIAIVPPSLHNQIASTAFSIIRPKPGVNPYYLHYALRLKSTLEQFRKWSTGSSYPAILDEDVEKTLIPLTSKEDQDRVARYLGHAHRERQRKISEINKQWESSLQEIESKISSATSKIVLNDFDDTDLFSLTNITRQLDALPSITFDATRRRGRRSAPSPAELQLDLNDTT